MWEVRVNRVIMTSELADEQLRGIEYSRDASRFRRLGNGHALFIGDRAAYVLGKGQDGVWHCPCPSFRRLHPLGVCRHSVAAQRIDEELALPASLPQRRGRLHTSSILGEGL